MLILNHYTQSSTNLNMILITGALGYIASHFAATLASQTQDKMLLLDNADRPATPLVNYLSSIASQPCEFFHIDILDQASLQYLFKQYPNIHSIIHFAAQKNVVESIHEPLFYYNENVVGSIELIKVAVEAGVQRFMFSSTAAVYSAVTDCQINESMPTAFNTPYSNSKLMFEQILRDYCQVHPEFSVIALRYFNVVGSKIPKEVGPSIYHPAEDLFASILKVIHNESPILNIYGRNYPTKDGTPVRDYIHVLDIALGHIQALTYMQQHRGFDVFNLGCNLGHTVYEIVKLFEKTIERPIPHQFSSRRPNDLGYVVADATKAERLGWKARYSIEECVRDAWENTYYPALNER